jgi:hypothetical protein
MPTQETQTEINTENFDTSGYVAYTSIQNELEALKQDFISNEGKGWQRILRDTYQRFYILRPQAPHTVSHELSLCAEIAALCADSLQRQPAHLPCHTPSQRALKMQSHYLEHHKAGNTGRLQRYLEMIEAYKFRLGLEKEHQLSDIIDINLNGRLNKTYTLGIQTDFTAVSPLLPPQAILLLKTSEPETITYDDLEERYIELQKNLLPRHKKPSKNMIQAREMHLRGLERDMQQYIDIIKSDVNRHTMQSFQLAVKIHAAYCYFMGQPLGQNKREEKLQRGYDRAAHTFTLFAERYQQTNEHLYLKEELWRSATFMQEQALNIKQVSACGLVLASPETTAEEKQRAYMQSTHYQDALTIGHAGAMQRYEDALDISQKYLPHEPEPVTLGQHEIGLQLQAAAWDLQVPQAPRRAELRARDCLNHVLNAVLPHTVLLPTNVPHIVIPHTHYWPTYYQFLIHNYPQQQENLPFNEHVLIQFLVSENAKRHLRQAVELYYVYRLQHLDAGKHTHVTKEERCNAICRRDALLIYLLGDPRTSLEELIHNYQQFIMDEAGISTPLIRALAKIKLAQAEAMLPVPESTPQTEEQASPNNTQKAKPAARKKHGTQRESAHQSEQKRNTSTLWDTILHRFRDTTAPGWKDKKQTLHDLFENADNLCDILKTVHKNELRGLFNLIHAKQLDATIKKAEEKIAASEAKVNTKAQGKKLYDILKRVQKANLSEAFKTCQAENLYDALEELKRNSLDAVLNDVEAWLNQASQTSNPFLYQASHVDALILKASAYRRLKHYADALTCLDKAEERVAPNSHATTQNRQMQTLLCEKAEILHDQGTDTDDIDLRNKSAQLRQQAKSKAREIGSFCFRALWCEVKGRTGIYRDHYLEELSFLLDSKEGFVIDDDNEPYFYNFFDIIAVSHMWRGLEDLKHEKVAKETGKQPESRESREIKALLNKLVQSPLLPTKAGPSIVIHNMFQGFDGLGQASQTSRKLPQESPKNNDDLDLAIKIYNVIIGYSLSRSPQKNMEFHHKLAKLYQSVQVVKPRSENKHEALRHQDAAIGLARDLNLPERAEQILQERARAATLRQQSEKLVHDAVREEDREAAYRNLHLARHRLHHASEATHTTYAAHHHTMSKSIASYLWLSHIIVMLKLLESHTKSSSVVRGQKNTLRQAILSQRTLLLRGITFHGEKAKELYKATYNEALQERDPDIMLVKQRYRYEQECLAFMHHTEELEGLEVLLELDVLKVRHQKVEEQKAEIITLEKVLQAQLEVKEEHQAIPSENAITELMKTHRAALDLSIDTRILDSFATIDSMPDHFTKALDLIRQRQTWQAFQALFNCLQILSVNATLLEQGGKQKKQHHTKILNQINVVYFLLGSILQWLDTAITSSEFAAHLPNGPRPPAIGVWSAQLTGIFKSYFNKANDGGFLSSLMPPSRPDVKLLKDVPEHVEGDASELRFG